MVDKVETHKEDIYPIKNEKESNFTFKLGRVLTYFLGLLISSFIFGFFGIAIGTTLDGNNGALIGFIIGLMLAVCFSFAMLSNKNLHSKT